MNDELYEWGRSLSAERQRRVPAERTTGNEADLRNLVKVLAAWIANPGPTDAEREAQNDPNGDAMTMPLFGPDVAPAATPAAEPVPCRRCGRPLTDETSLGYEIGPVCRDRLGITDARPSIPWSCTCDPIDGQVALFDLDDNGAAK